MHSIGSRFVTGPSDTLFGGVYVCTFQPRNCTGCGSEGINSSWRWRQLRWPWGRGRGWSHTYTHTHIHTHTHTQSHTHKHIHTQSVSQTSRSQWHNENEWRMRRLFTCCAILRSSHCVCARQTAVWCSMVISSSWELGSLRSPYWGVPSPHLYHYQQSNTPTRQPSTHTSYVACKIY